METAQKKPLLFYLSLLVNVVLILVLAFVVMSSKVKTPQQISSQSQLDKLNQEFVQYKTKSVPLAFNPKEKYINSTSVYQQVIGRVVSFATESSTLTLTNGGEAFTVVIPLGKNTSYVPSGFADVGDMNKFKVGDEVTIGGSVDTTGEFKVSKFTISKKATK